MVPILFNVFINDPENGVVCTLNKFADDIKPGGVADTPDEYGAMQKDRLETWANKSQQNEMHISLGKFL